MECFTGLFLPLSSLGQLVDHLELGGLHLVELLASLLILLVGPGSPPIVDALVSQLSKSCLKSLLPLTLLLSFLEGLSDEAYIARVSSRRGALLPETPRLVSTL